MRFNLNEKNSYHIHTSLCNHSDIEPEKFVKLAIEKGYDEIAFTDHIWYPDEKLSMYRVKEHEADAYLDECVRLKELYKDQISILVGYESEYFPEYKQHYIDIKNDPRVEFMLLSNHYFGGIYDKNIIWHELDEEHYLQENLDLLKEAWELNIFDAFAHPDIVYHNLEFTEFAKEVSLKMADYIIEKKIPVEINANGIRKEPSKNENGLWQGYPNFEFWNIMTQKGVKTVISNGDTHFYDELDGHAEQLARKFAIEINEGNFTLESDLLKMI